MSSKPQILVTGATGQVGYQASLSLLKENSAIVKCLVRSSSDKAKELEKMGAVLVFGDMNSAPDMLRALSGVDAAFCLPPVSHHSLMSSTTFLTQAVVAKVKHVVLLSQWLASDCAPNVLTKQHWLMEKQFEQSGLSYTIIAPGFFATNYLDYGFVRMANNIGMYGHAMSPHAKNCPPSNEDIGACCASALLGPKKFNGKRFRPTGPQTLSMEEMTEVIGKVVGRKLSYMQLPRFMLLQNMTYQAMDPFLILSTVKYCEEADKGGFEAGGSTNHVKLLTGKEPESFQTIAKRYANLPENAATFGNKMSTIGDLLLSSFYIPFNLGSIAHQLQLPIEANPQFAAENAKWREDRVKNISGLRL